MTSRKLIVPKYTKDIRSENIERLLDILASHNVYTKKCVCCGWVDTYNHYYKCQQCKSHICHECVVRASMELETDDENSQIESEQIEDKETMVEDVYCEFCQTK